MACPEMRTTGGTTTLPTNLQASHSQGRSGDERGLITLEWLLIVGAIAGLAASSVLTVQRVLDDTSEVPVDPLVRLLEADVAAAFVAADAQAAFDESLSNPLMPYVDQGFRERCETGVEDAFDDVVTRARWTRPADPNGTLADLTDDVAARCVATPRANLGA